MRGFRWVDRLAGPLHRWRQPKPWGPLGDEMTPSERMTWRVMKVYRRWSVFVALQGLTVVWWLHPAWFPGGLPSWNYVWSDLAIIVEMMVGIAFLNQAMRDGAVLRQEMRELRQEAALLRKIAEHLGVRVPSELPPPAAPAPRRPTLRRSAPIAPSRLGASRRPKDSP